MRKTLVSLLLAGLLLAACGDKKEDEDQPPAQVQATATVDPYEGTEQPSEDVAGQEMVPGVRSFGGLEIVNSNTYTNDNGIGWIAVEVRNANDFTVSAIDMTVSLLDSQNRERDFQRATSPFLNIPAGYVLPLVLEFAQPTDYKDFVALVDVDESVGGSYADYTGEYDLPSTTDALPTGDAPYIVTGTLTNDRGMGLLFPAASVAAYAADGKLLGVAQAVLGGTNASGGWDADAVLTFQATFVALPAPIATIRVASAGYHKP